MAVDVSPVKISTQGLVLGDDKSIFVTIDLNFRQAGKYTLI